MSDEWTAHASYGVFTMQVRGLEKIIAGRRVLALNALDVAAGEVVAVIGPVGSGKSLLIRLLSGTIPPSGGSVLFSRAGLARSGPMRGHVGVLFEEDLLYDRLSVRENLTFHARLLHGFPTMPVADVLLRMGLSDQARQPVATLAPSARRRLAFARVLMGRHCIVLLDQPMLRADLDTHDLFVRLITQMAAAGAAVVLTDEDLTWASRCATRVVELEEGRVASTYILAGDREPPGPERFTPFRVPARKDDSILLYDPAEILFATSRDGRTYLFTAKGEIVAHFTLQELEQRLAGRGFFKAHRAYLVNLQHIKAVIRYSRSSYALQLDDKQQTLIPLSKQSEKELQELLAY